MTTKSAAVDWKVVAKLLGGGALVGGGVGAATSYMRHLDALKHEVEHQNPESQDDDILYIDLPRHRLSKKASDDSSSGGTFAMGGLASLLGAYLAYNTVRGRYNKSRKKDLQKSLDSAQHVYVDNLSQAKQAGFPLLSQVSGGFGLATLLTALGTAVVANRALGKQFPAVKRPGAEAPRRIVVRSPDDAEETVKDNGKNSPDAKEAMLRTVLQLKTAAFNFHDVVSAVAAGRCDEVFSTCQDLSPMAVFDVCKGASLTKQSAVNTNLAITWLCTEPMVSAALEPCMGAAFHDGLNADAKQAGITRLAQVQPEAVQWHLYKLAEASTSLVRQSIFSRIAQPGMDKLALELSDITTAGAIRNLLMHNADQEGEAGQGSAAVQRTTSKDSTDLDQKNGHPVTGPQVEVSGPEAEEFLAKFGPELTAALQRPAH